MDKKAAEKIRLADYTGNAEFLALCSFANRNGFGAGEEFMYRAPNGLLFDCTALVKQADQANIAQKGKVCTASLTFVLEYLDMCFIPYSRFDDAAKALAKKYNASIRDPQTHKVDECTAMAALLMVAVGYEQRKLCVLRHFCNKRNKDLALANDTTSPRWRVLDGETYSLYHIDFVEHRHGTPLRVFQVERSKGYYDLLEYRKESKNLHPAHKANIDRNRRQCNAFLDKYPETEFLLMTAQTQPVENGGKRGLGIYGPYERVEPLSAQ